MISYFGAMLAKVKAPLKGLYHELKLISYTRGIKAHSKQGDEVLTVHFDDFLMNADMGRFSFILCQYFRFSGFRLNVRIDKSFIRQLAPPYKKLFLAQDYKLTRSCTAAVNTVEWISSSGCRKKIELVYGYRYIGTQESNAYYLPFPLHPKFYVNLLHNENLLPLRDQSRGMGVFFAGNSDERLYNRDVLQEYFRGTVSRHNALRHIKACFGDAGSLELVTEPSRLYDLMVGEGSKIVLSEARTPGEHWLKILGRANFFLCLPGVRMPWSHNAVEAMSVGTIPVIQYGALFVPPLEHLETAVCYSTQEELVEVVNEILSLPDSEIARMKANVIRYYETHLAPTQVVGKLSQFFSSGESLLRIIIPYVDNPEK